MSAHGCEPEASCITCGDVAVALTVSSVEAARGLATCVAPDGRREVVETALVAGVRAGDVLLVHAGTALARLEEEVPR